MNYEVQVGLNAVWVNVETGECLGRFGKMGIDVHQTVAKQMEGYPQCLFCTHSATTKKDWEDFVSAMARHHAID